MGLWEGKVVVGPTKTTNVRRVKGKENFGRREGAWLFKAKRDFHE